MNQKTAKLIRKFCVSACPKDVPFKKLYRNLKKEWSIANKTKRSQTREQMQQEL
jgi:hypothetical protein